MKSCQSCKEPLLSEKESFMWVMFHKPDKADTFYHLECFRLLAGEMRRAAADVMGVQLS